ncbi:MAG: hypothetical protein JOZ16_06710 [Methylobacteriaceae bacterium]|nr:hypothetical protein [Methylobacteriaceae bacterium]
MPAAPSTAEPQKQVKKGQSAASAEKLPCPRAAYKNDPVCADAPDEHTLPTPSMNSAVPPRAPVEPVKIGAKWQANNPIAAPTPRLQDVPGSDFQSRNTPPDTHVGVGLDMHF